MSIPEKTRSLLVEQYQRRCPVCGRTDVDLQICHIVPVSAGGTDDITNLVVMCPTCHASFDRYQPTEVEFIAFLTDLLQKHPHFEGTRMEERVSEKPPLRADIITVERRNKQRRTILIECKRTAFFTERRLRGTIAQIQMYSAHARFDICALAFPGRLSPEMQQVLVSEKIEIWDIDFIAQTFAEQIKDSAYLFFKGLILSVAPLTRQSPEIHLLKKIKNCQPGKRDWSDYQKIVGQVFERLFCPPLQAPLLESADAAGINRRDLIFPNYADAGFWRFLREMYKADYIVVDAKNYKTAVGKHQVLQIANYLKPHGAGMFALIATRAGADNAARLTIREQWMAYQKMILVLDDESLEVMLLAASSGGDAAKVIGQLIEDFRLSM
jgi:hypothetical protein